MTTTRREFLKYSAAGLAGAALPGSNRSQVHSRQEPRQDDTPLTYLSYFPLSDEERQSLVSAAHFGKKPAVSSTSGMAITSHPLATREAIHVLEQGGNACDAACAAALTQTVVEPHMTTLTGVFSLLYYDAAEQRTYHMNGSNNAPLVPLEGFKLGNILRELKTGRGVTVPGFWAGIEAALERFGSFPRRRILAPAIHYARNGFEIHPFLWGEIFVQAELIGKSLQGREIYFPGKALVKPGEKLVQKRAAGLLDRLAEEGSSYFYRGDFARRFSVVVQQAGGIITPRDFSAYRAMWQQPASGSYRDFTIQASPPPDFGGSSMIEILNMAELLDLDELGPAWDSSETAWWLLRILAEVLTSGIMQRQSGKIMPLKKLLSKEYAAERFSRIKDTPQDFRDPLRLPMPPSGSNHLTVVDPRGNVATVLHSCMSFPWQNGLFVEGISICAAGAHYGVGMPRPGERIHARICPIIFFKNQKPVLAAGSPSVSLMENMLQNITNLMDFGLTCEESVAKPRFGGGSLSNPGTRLIESDMKQEIIRLLQDKGMRLDRVNPWNWHHGTFEGIKIDPGSGRRTACSDPRRAGGAEGMD
jgi:gamma-glutamyltranspeptidase/glutathione hydrolase